MTISRPNKYLFVSFLGSYLHGTEMTSFEKTISLFNAGLFFYLLFCLFVFFFLTLAKANQVLHCLLKN